MRGIWKHVIKGVGQIFPSADSFRYTIWKYAIPTDLITSLFITTAKELL